MGRVFAPFPSVEYPIIKQGQMVVDGKLYTYQIRKLTNNLGVNAIEIENQQGDQADSVIFDDSPIDDVIRAVAEFKKWT